MNLSNKQEKKDLAKKAMKNKNYRDITRELFPPKSLQECEDEALMKSCELLMSKKGYKLVKQHLEKTYKRECECAVCKKFHNQGKNCNCNICFDCWEYSKCCGCKICCHIKEKHKHLTQLLCPNCPNCSLSDTKVCTYHNIKLTKSVGWYGEKYECKKCLTESLTPNGNPDTKVKEEQSWEEKFRERFWTQLIDDYADEHLYDAVKQFISQTLLEERRKGLYQEGYNDANKMLQPVIEWQRADAVEAEKQRIRKELKKAPPTHKGKIIDKIIIGDDGDKEVLCKHGVGHGGGVHTCDWCCLSCVECLGKGYHYEGFEDKEICYRCNGIGVILK